MLYRPLFDDLLSRPIFRRPAIRRYALISWRLSALYRTAFTRTCGCGAALKMLAWRHAFARPGGAAILRVMLLSAALRHLAYRWPSRPSCCEPIVRPFHDSTARRSYWRTHGERNGRKKLASRKAGEAAEPGGSGRQWAVENRRGRGPGGWAWAWAWAGWNRRAWPTILLLHPSPSPSLPSLPPFHSPHPLPTPSSIPPPPSGIRHPPVHCCMLATIHGGDMPTYASSACFYTCHNTTSTPMP